MKSLKKTLVLLVVLSMILSAVSPVFAFNDVIAEEYAEQANKMAAFGVFAGDADGNFNADAEITRAEMAVIIGKLMGLTENEANANKVYNSNFSDVVAGDWYTGWVNLVAGRGIISGFPDGTFRPNEKVTQAQAVTMIVKALGWGVVVDQTGTWPANYITKASELRLFKNAVDTNSELVTRGNVAIYCYNALTAKTWDVTESTDGKLTSSAFNTDTILAKYFSDFVNEEGKMKLVEDAKVTATGATTTAIGANQVRIEATDLVDFIDAEKAPKKGEEDVTYYVTGSTTSVIAYVPTEVANTASLLNKTVDVIFGKDNEVAYLVVTNDVLDNSFVTAWDYDGADTTIEIDGEEYEFADTSAVVVKVYNTQIGTGIADIEALLDTTLGCVDAKGNLTRNIVADIELDADDEIETINFKFSVPTYGSASTVKVEEKIVEEVTAKKFEYANGSDSISTLEDAEPRVVRNNEIASLEDIEAGDVLTVITTGTNIVIYAVSNTVEGTVVDYTAKTNALEIGEDEYKVVDAPYYNVDGETDDYAETTAATILTTFEDEDVTAYMNMFGEVVAVVGESEATGMTLGVITDVETSTDEDADDVEYLKIKILAENGTNKSYKIYNKKTNKNVSAADEWTAIDALVENDVVVFSADADRVIKSDDIEKVVNDEEYTISNNEVTAIVVADATTVYDADIDNSRLTLTNGGSQYKHSSSTVVINYSAEKELISWEALTNDTKSNDLAATGKLTLFVKGTKLIYAVANVAKVDYGASDDMYGIITDFGRDYDEDGDRIYLVTVLSEGETTTYECTSALREAFEVGDLIKFNVSEEAIKETTSPAAPTTLVAYSVVEAVEDLVDEDTYSGHTMEYYKVDAVDAETIEFKWVTKSTTTAVDCDACENGTVTTTAACTATHATSTCTETHTDGTACGVCGSSDGTAGTVTAVDCDACENGTVTTTSACTATHTATTTKTTNYRIVDLDEEVVVYDLVTGEMGEISEGDYVLVFNTDSDSDNLMDIVVIIK